MNIEQLPICEGLFGTFFLLSNRLETISNRYLGELTTKQWFLLAIVTSFYTAPPTLTQIAGDMQLSHQNIKKIAAKLQDKGFVQLTADKEDKRVTRVCVTKKTQEYGQEMDKLQSMFLNEFFAGVDDAEKKRCLFTLMKLLNNLTRIERKEEKK